MSVIKLPLLFTGSLGEKGYILYLTVVLIFLVFILIL